MITLFWCPQTRASRILWLLEEMGEPFEVRLIDIRKPEAGEDLDFIAASPMGKVPAIKHGATVVTECAAICAYMADAFPDANLAPALSNRGAYYRWLLFAAGPLESAITNKALGFEVPEDREVMAGYGSLSRALDAIDSVLDNSPYITGDTFTAADVYVGSQISWGLQFETIEKRDSFVNYAARVTDRDAYRRANELDGPMG